MSDKAKYGYLAGIMDGEGTITICRSEYIAEKKGGKYRSIHHYATVGYHVKVQVKNTDIRLMNWLKKMFGGEFYPDKSKRPENWKVSYVWHYPAESKQEFLLAILPYLIIKREQAIVALEFLRIGKQVRCPEKRQELYEKIVALNQRGKLVETNTLDTVIDKNILRCGDEMAAKGVEFLKTVMRESVLDGDIESAPVVTQVIEYPCTGCGGKHKQFEGCFAKTN